jgi:NADH:ubiquinone oxidoreductase subunit E
MVTEVANRTVEQQMETVLAAHSRGQKDALIPILQETQAAIGYLPAQAMRDIARFIATTPNEVFGVASFYAQFRFKPTGVPRDRLSHPGRAPAAGRGAPGTEHRRRRNDPGR